MSDFKIGQTVETTTNQQGLVKYVGPIHVAEGTWLGIELSTPTGKNDGSVRGERYFSCPPAHGLFIKDTSIARVVSQPPAKALSKPAIKPATVASTSTKATTTKPRPSSVIAPKPSSRLSTISKRQSVAPTSTHTTFRAPVRKPSTTATSSTSVAATSATTNTNKSSRDSNVETLQTKIRHFEKQHADDQDRLKELGQARDERDRFNVIIQKLQAKCQKLLQDDAEQKVLLQQLQAENEKLSRGSQEHEVDLEDALIDKEMAEERAEQAETELDSLRAKIEERDMELEILREEAELYTTEITAEEREEAGYYRLQHENERLREALITLKEMTGEQEQSLKARIRELENDISSLEKTQQDTVELHEQLTTANSVIEHLRAQLDANAEWEDVSNELTTKCHELEDRVASQEVIIQDLESLRELNDELETQHVEQEEELRNELDAKDIEIAEQHRRIVSQDALITDHEDLIGKFRELVFELQGKMTDAESSRNMTESQAKDTVGRFNEVMDLNRRLRASNVQATDKAIVSELRKIRADEAEEKLSICTQASSEEFGNSETLRAYFTSKRVAAKASLLSDLLAATDRQLSYNGGFEEAASRLACVESIQHLTLIRSGSDRLWSAIAVSSLAQFASFGPIYSEVITIEKSLDQGLDALKVDTVNFPDLAAALERSSETNEAVLDQHEDALAALPEDVILARIQNITSCLEYLDANFAVIIAMLNVLADHGGQRALEHIAPSSVICNRAMLSAQKLLRTTVALRNDRLYPKFLGGSEEVIRMENKLMVLADQAAEIGQGAIRIVSTHFDVDGAFNGSDLNLSNMLLFYWSSDLYRLNTSATELDHWTDEVSVLLNSCEIEHGPTPWSQKAKQMEAARQKNSEATVLLENLRAEHKATLLSLHERERVIETKSLEIEHLEAKHREATNKVGDNQQLRDKIKVAEEEVAALQKQVRAQQQEIETLEAQANRSDDASHIPVTPNAPNATKASLEQTAGPERIPAGVTCMLNALQEESHWLRLRENSSLFDRSLREMFVHMEIARRAEKFLAGDMTVEEYYEYTAIEDDDSDDDESQADAKAAVSKTCQEDQAVSVPQARFSRHKMSPLALDSVQTGWQPRADSAVGDWNSLYTIEEEGDTLELEGFSEIDNTLDLEGFSEL